MVLVNPPFSAVHPANRKKLKELAWYPAKSILMTQLAKSVTIVDQAASVSFLHTLWAIWANLAVIVVHHPQHQKARIWSALTASPYPTRHVQTREEDPRKNPAAHCILINVSRYSLDRTTWSVVRIRVANRSLTSITMVNVMTTFCWVDLANYRLNARVMLNVSILEAKFVSARKVTIKFQRISAKKVVSDRNREWWP